MVKNGICVANHTSPLDVIILSCDNCYSLVSKELLIIIEQYVLRFNSFINCNAALMKENISTYYPVSSDQVNISIFRSNK